MLKILTVPNDILLQKSLAIKFPLSLEDKNLALEMQKMVKEDKGSAGLAAPQVGVLKKVVIVTDKDRKPKILINPKITFFSPKKVKMNEGCLSIPKKLFEVERAFNIKIEYFNLKGRKVLETLTGWEARVVQHEVDHLEGILISEIGVEVTEKEQD